MEVVQVVQVEEVRGRGREVMVLRNTFILLICLRNDLFFNFLVLRVLDSLNTHDHYALHLIRYTNHYALIRARIIN